MNPARGPAPGTARYDRPVATPRTCWASTAAAPTHRRTRRLVAVGALALLAAAAGCGGSAGGGSSAGLAVTVKAHGVPSLTATSCRLGASGGTVTAIGQVDRPSATALSLSLDVLSASDATLVAAGAAHTATEPAGSRRWLVQTRVTPGFPPARCVVTATAAEVLVTQAVTSASMTSTVPTGARVIVDQSAYTSATPKAGDVVSVRPPASPACAGATGPVGVDRVIGLPGQTVGATGGQVTVDGTVLAEPWLPRADRTRTADFGPVAVGAGDYFVMGDNRADTCDSRTWGPLPGGDITGRVIKVIPPPGTVTTVTVPTRATSPPETVTTPT